MFHLYDLSYHNVQFEDGTIIKNRTYFQFKNGLILQEKACRVENFLDRVGEQSISKSGHKMSPTRLLMGVPLLSFICTASLGCDMDPFLKWR